MSSMTETKDYPPLSQSDFNYFNAENHSLEFSDLANYHFWGFYTKRDRKKGDKPHKELVIIIVENPFHTASSPYKEMFIRTIFK